MASLKNKPCIEELEARVCRYKAQVNNYSNYIADQERRMVALTAENERLRALLEKPQLNFN